LSLISAKNDQWLMRTYRRPPVVFVRGKGMTLFDEDGNQYLDFVAGVAVNALGHAHPAVTQAVAEHAGNLIHTSNLYYTGPQATLAERLCELLGWPDGRVFFANSGAEANECGLKIARKWAIANLGPQATKTVAAWGSFHGRTFETLAATGQPKKWASFAPLPADFKHAPYDNLGALEDACQPDVGSVLLEPIQGEGGVLVPSPAFLEGAAAVCSKAGIPLILDEVQTGIGRTGSWFAFQQHKMQPGMITAAKALGGGLPIGACVARGPWAETFVPGDHATTMGGNPLACSAALAVLDTIKNDDLIGNAVRVGEYLKAALEKLAGRYPAIMEVRGRGLLLGLALNSDVAHNLVETCLAKGLLVNDVMPSVIRLCPPLIVTPAECDQAVAILDEAFGAHGTAA